MYKQLYKENLTLQKSFCDLYCHLADKNYNGKTSPNWIQEKKQLQRTISNLKTKVAQLENELRGTNERCELLEFCFLELENEKNVLDYGNLVDSGVNTDPCWLSYDLVGQLPNSSLLKLGKAVCECWALNNKDFDSNTSCCCCYRHSTLNMDQKLCRKKLEESRKKLSDISRQMDHVNQQGKWCGIDQVVSSIEELQDLISWVAEKKGNQEDNSIILQKLQQLNKIKKILEKTAIETQDLRKAPNFGQATHNNNDISNPNIIPANHGYVNPPSPEFFRSSNESYINNKIDEMPLHTLEDYNKSFDSDDLTLYMKKLCSLGPSLNSQPSGDLSKETFDPHDSLGTAVSEDEGLGEESKRGDSTGPNSLLEMSDNVTELILHDANANLSGEYKESSSPVIRRERPWMRDSCCHRNSIELCLATITKLKESLQAKENEIVNLKKVTEDKNDESELQTAISLQQNIEELQSSVFLLEKENSSLKENLLELEEAENDARSRGQKVEEKLAFLQQKDSHFQAEFAETKRALKMCLEELSLKDTEERELNSQLKIMEILVHKYEGQLKNLESQKKKDHIDKKTQTIAEQDATEINRPRPLEIQDSLLEATDDGNHPLRNNIKHVERIDCGMQTALPVEVLISDGGMQPLLPFAFGLPNSARAEKENIEDKCITCPAHQEMATSLHHLVEEGADLQQQLNHADQINVSLWEKLHSLQFDIDECQDDSQGEKNNEKSVATFNMKTQSIEGLKLIDSSIFDSLECSEGKLKERLSHLEKINFSFLKKLEMREKLYLEQEQRHEKWLKMEEELTKELKSLGDERDSLLTQVTHLEVEKVQLASKVQSLEAELSLTREKHQQEASKITTERDEIMTQLQTTIDDLLIREKEYMKQIAKLRSTKNKADEKSEFENLKSSYVQLQIELVGYRDQMENMRNEFDDQLYLLKENHSVEESRLLDELGEFQDKDSNCNRKLDAFQNRQVELENDLKRKERCLEQARNDFKENMQRAEEQHKAVETELRRRLQEMEEGTAFATKALTEERERLEKELQENIEDLRSKEELYKARILELELNVSQLHQELHRLTGNLHTKFDGDGIENRSRSFQRERLLNELQELRIREEELRDKLDEMEKKELAYRETLEHADRIVASLERGYKNKIEELELSERCLKQRVSYLEEVENRLRVALQKERRSSDGRRPEDLMLELVEAEKRESNLKEEIDSLEVSNRSASNKVRELEKVQQRLESQLNDHEELATSLENLQHERDSIRKELAKLRKSEQNLQMELHQTESLLEARQAELEAELKRFSDEKKDLEETISQLRCQVRELKEKMEKSFVEEQSLSKNIPIALDIQPLATTLRPLSNNKQTSLAFYDGITPTCSSNLPDSLQEINMKNNCKLPTSPELLSNLHAETTWQAAKRNENIGAKSFNSITPLGDEKTNSSALGSPSGASGITKIEKEYCEVRLQLEECMLRAMDAMKMEMDNKTAELSLENSESKKDSFLPPYNFRVVQQVGSDTLLVGWEYSEVPNLEGFELYVNDQLHETVYAPDRRKAVISGLDLNKSLVLSICSVSSTGQVSKPQTLELSQKNLHGFFFQDEEDEDDDDELFDDDVIPEKQLRPYSVDW